MEPIPYMAQVQIQVDNDIEKKIAIKRNFKNLR